MNQPPAKPATFRRDDNGKYIAYHPSGRQMASALTRLEAMELAQRLLDHGIQWKLAN